ncbi:MAG: PAS domain S-box protein, partial [Dehalococcoidia bacterium]
MSAALTASLVGRDGWWLIQAATLVSMVGAVLALDDVVQRRQQFSRQREALRQFRSVVPDVLFEASPDGVFRTTSPSSARVLGLSPSEIRGRAITDFTADALPPMHPDSVERVSWTTTWTLPDGSVRSLNTLLNPSWDPNGRLKMIRGVIRDQAERVAAEVALRESEVRFRRVLDAAQNGIMLVSHEGQLLLT